MALKNKDLGNEEVTSSREISEHYGTPFDTTAKIMQALVNGDILKSSQGVKGGYTLNKNLKEINFIELTEIIEKKKFEFSCEGPSGLCDLFSVCNIKSPLQSINMNLKKYFEGISLHELLHIDQDINVGFSNEISRNSMGAKQQ